MDPIDAEVVTAAELVLKVELVVLEVTVVL